MTPETDYLNPEVDVGPPIEINEVQHPLTLALLAIHDGIGDSLNRYG